MKEDADTGLQDKMGRDPNMNENANLSIKSCKI